MDLDWDRAAHLKGPFLFCFAPLCPLTPWTSPEKTLYNVEHVSRDVSVSLSTDHHIRRFMTGDRQLGREGRPGDVNQLQ